MKDSELEDLKRIQSNRLRELADQASQLSEPEFKRCVQHLVYDIQDTCNALRIGKLQDYDIEYVLYEHYNTCKYRLKDFVGKNSEEFISDRETIFKNE
jgi:hypothetical protein